MFRFLVLLITLCEINAQYLPTLVWDSDHPFFQCSDPILRIRKQDRLQIHCMDKLLHNYLRSYKTAPIAKTRMILAKDEEHYKTCNAEGSTRLLSCAEGQTEQKCKGGLDCTKHYDMNVLDGAPYFTLKQGEMHHFIGVSYDSFYDDRGPCFGNGTDPEFMHPLKFKVYVCTQDEEAAGKCDPCTTEACFYSRCQEECGDWKDSDTTKIVYDKQGNCHKQQTQTCIDKFTSSSRTNTKDITVPCPTQQCKPWEVSELINYEGGVCSKIRRRECVNFRGVRSTVTDNVEIKCPTIDCSTTWSLVEEKKTYIEGQVTCFEKHHKYCKFQQPGKQVQLFLKTKEKNVTCKTEATTTTTTTTTTPTPTPLVAAASKVKRDDSDEDLYIKIAIGASIASFALGILVGTCLFKCLQRHTKQVEIVKTVKTEKFVPVEGLGPSMAYNNKHFHLDPVLEDGEPQAFIADVEFVPSTQQNGTAQRKVMVARSISFYNPEDPIAQKYQEHHRRSSDGTTHYEPPSTKKESNRNVARHPSANSKTVLIRHHSDVTDRARSDSDTSGGVFDLKQPEDSVSEMV